MCPQIVKMPAYEPEKGEHYYAALCPKTGGLLAIEEDPSHGQRPYSGIQLLITCHHCQIGHQFDRHEIFSLREGEEARPRA